jgi:hypothetical protein
MSVLEQLETENQPLSLTTFTPASMDIDEVKYKEQEKLDEERQGYTLHEPTLTMGEMKNTKFQLKYQELFISPGRSTMPDLPGEFNNDFRIKNIYCLGSVTTFPDFSTEPNFEIKIAKGDHKKSSSVHPPLPFLIDEPDLSFQSHPKPVESERSKKIFELIDFCQQLHVEKMKNGDSKNDHLSAERRSHYCSLLKIDSGDEMAKKVNEFTSSCRGLFGNSTGFVKKVNDEIKGLLKDGVDKNFDLIKQKMAVYELSYQYDSVRPSNFHFDIWVLLNEIMLEK